MDALGEIKNLKCNVCGQQFLGDQKFLDFHKRIAHSGIPTANSISGMSCNICKKIFSRKDKVVRHYQTVHLKLKPHKCHICNKSFGMRYVLRKHIKMTHQRIANNLKLKPHKCNICDKSFVRKYSLRKHAIKNKHQQKEDLVLKPNKNGKSLCSICNKVLHSSIKKHINMVHLKFKPFSCPDCGAKFSTQFHLKRHLVSHKKSNSKSLDSTSLKLEKGEINEEILENFSINGNYNVGTELESSIKCSKNEIEQLNRESTMITNRIEGQKDNFDDRLVCNICSKVFKSKQNVKSHIDEVHLKIKPYPCPECNRHFAKNSHLKRHLIYHQKHSMKILNDSTEELLTNDNDLFVNGDPFQEVAASFKCNDCEKCFPDSYKFKRHYDAVHLNLKPFKCHICVKKFRDRSMLGRHTNSVHVMVKGIKCEKCNETFSRQSDLRIHLTKVHFELLSFPCNSCNKMFHDQRSLKKHCNVFHKQKKLIESELVETTISKKALKMHVKSTHGKIRDYKCKQCDVAFSKLAPLQRHERHIHLNLRLYSCNNCDKTFKRNEHLKKHKKSHKNS